MAPNWGESAVDLLFLPAVLAAAVLGGIGPALFAASASALAYNFFFTAPRLSFRMDNLNDIVTVATLFGVAVATSHLAASVRRQARIAQAHSARDATIAGLAGRLLACTTPLEIADVSTGELGAVFGCNSVLVGELPDARLLSRVPAPLLLTPADIAVATFVLDKGEPAGRGVDRSASTEWQFHPVISGSVVIAAIGLARDDGAAPVRQDQLPLLENLLDQVALALERGRLEAQAREFERVRERDQVRSVLLLSLGQDLEPPLKAIKDAVGEMKRGGSGDKTLLSRVGSEARRIELSISNLLDLSPESDRQPLVIGGFVVDLFQRRVFSNGKEVHLTPKEYAVLAELSKHPGRVLTHAHLLRAAWGPAQEGQIDYLRVSIRALRQKLERNPSRPELIVNEPAVGYRLRAS